MNTGCVNGARHDLHWLAVRPVTANYLQVAPAGHQHGMPVEQHLIGQPVGPSPIEVCHELGGSGFGGIGAPVIRLQAEVLRQR